MPYIIKKTPSCPASKPFGVFNKNTGDLRGRCHPSKAKALAQMRALYAAESGTKMNSEVAVINLVKEFSDEWLEGNRKWIKVYPYSSWSHPIFSDTEIDQETAQALKESFDNKYYGEQDYVVSYDHGLDPAKGGKAAGWYEKLDVRDDGLWGLVRFTDIARQEIDAGEWRYFSGEHFDEFKNPHTGEEYNLVFSGGAVTNKPYVKEGMIPLNFSDVFIEKANSEVGMPDETKNESVPNEHADPGQTQDPPLEGANTDDAADKGTRVDSPPPSTQTQTDARLREILGLDPDADIIKATTDLMAEVKPLRDAAKAHSEKKSFAEMYPAEAAKMKRFEEKERNDAAKAFSERYLNVADDTGKITNKGFPAVVTNKLEEMHKKFSDGSASIIDVTEVLDLVSKTGLVDYTETGSSRVDPYASSDAPKAFADKVIEIQEADKVDYRTAVGLASERHPDLYEGYRKSIPGRRQ